MTYTAALLVSLFLAAVIGINIGYDMRDSRTKR